MAKINILKIDPAPIATPAEEINGILLAKYLKPRRIIDKYQSTKMSIKTNNRLVIELNN